MSENINTSEYDKALKRIERANEIAKKYPEAEWRTIYHTLVLLEKTPIERLGYGLLRRGKVQITS